MKGRGSWGSPRAMSGWRLLALAVGASGVMAGYMSVSVNQTEQCGAGFVQWSGDNGPFHLLLTPTDFVEHGYNLWVPEITKDQSNITIPIRQPAGMSFLITVWGASGIEYAGTTDVQTVGTSDNSTCFLTDAEILALYTFSFNIPDTSSGYPPQCSNLSMSWPTSLESNVTGTTTRRSVADVSTAVDAILHSDAVQSLDIQINQYDQSSSEHTSGNTSTPPTLFGIIPLGNSFNIPITYGNNTAAAKNLPASSLSDTPTTWTSQGVTHLNWTVDMAKGTRFILVAGIGTDQQWASGGSSKMLTVGQGSTGCVGSEDKNGDGTPSVTGSSTSTATVAPDDANGAGDSGGMSPAVKTAVACALSVVATLVIVGLLFFCCRIRRRRRALLAPAYSLNAGSGKNGKNKSGRGDGSSPDTQLDLIASREGPAPQAGSRALAPINTALPDGQGSATSPSSSDPFHDTPNRALLANQSNSSLISLMHRTSIPGRSGAMGRHESQEALLHHPPHSSSRLSSPMNTFISGVPSLPSISTHRPLMLHDRTGLPDDELDEDDVPDLKRDTLNCLSNRPGPSGGEVGGGNAMIGATGVGAGRNEPVPPRRRRTDDRETEYVVHRDAGRVDAGTGGQVSGPRVLELPPRYEELDWENGPEGSQTLTT